MKISLLLTKKLRFRQMKYFFKTTQLKGNRAKTDSRDSSPNEKGYALIKKKKKLAISGMSGFVSNGIFSRIFLNQEDFLVGSQASLARPRAVFCFTHAFISISGLTQKIQS